MNIREKIVTNTTAQKKEHPASNTQKSEFSPSTSSPVDQILQLQRTIGNRAVQRMIESGMLQKKLRIGKSNDIYGQEANRVADQVMRPEGSALGVAMPDPGLQRQPEDEGEESIQTKPLVKQITPFVPRQVEPEKEEEEAEEPIQTKPITEQITPLIQKQAEPDEKEEEPIQAKGKSSTTAEISPGVESSINSLKKGGQPLPAATRKYFDPRYGQRSNRVAQAAIQRQTANKEGSESAKFEDEWERKAKELNELRKQGPMTSNLADQFLKMVNEVLRDYFLIAEKFPEGPFLNLQDSHIYFDKDFVDSAAETGMICRYRGRKEKRFKDECPPSEFDGSAIRIGPKIIMETRAFVLSVIRHEYTHIQQNREKLQGVSLSNADAEVEAYSEQLYYIYELSDMELQGTITSYLSYYINASIDAKRKSYALISKYLRSRLGRGRRTAADVEETLKKLRITSHWKIPSEKKPLADRRLNAMINEVHRLQAGAAER